MTNLYVATYPAGTDYRDVLAVSAANLPRPPDTGPQQPNQTSIQVGYTVALTVPQVTAWQNAVAATSANPNAPFRVLDSLNTKARAALTANATYQAIGAPSVAQNTAQIQSLTKQCNGIIRLLLGQLDSTTGT